MWLAPAVVNNYLRADHLIGLPKEGSITPLAYSYTLADIDSLLRWLTQTSMA